MSWNECKNILCIRADNMGDVIMTTPALRALKQTFGCRVTLLTSTMGSLITPYIKEVDETIACDLPWIKSNAATESNPCFTLIEKLKKYQFDAVIIFTVYSQNPLPAAMLAYMANIPLRLAYCRENPYDLLTDWIPDKEPYSGIKHQVKRDLHLVKNIGAETNDEHFSVDYSRNAYSSALLKLSSIGFDAGREFIIAHPGVSEEKRRYPTASWIKALKMIKDEADVQILLTGSKNENALTRNIQYAVGKNAFAVAELLSLEESIAVIANAALVISVNTSTTHIASAFKTPVVVLYAQTNPQHIPWLTKSTVLQYSVPEALRSKNEVIEFVNQSYYKKHIDYPLPSAVAAAALDMLSMSVIKMQPIHSS
jgi:ADP-heptose:LPS heptosyltransferase